MSGITKQYIDKNKFYFKINKKYFLYNTQNNESLICNKTIIDYLKMMATLNSTKKNVHVNENEYMILKSKNFVENNKIVNKIAKNSLLIIINLTQRCNLACDYCYVNKNDISKQKAIDFNSIKRISDLIKVKNCEDVTINFHGGEPLLYFSELKKIICFLEKEFKDEKKINIFYRLQTNGIKLNDRMAVFLKKHNVFTSISLDGPQYIHDYNRLYRNGDGTYFDVLRGIKCMKKNKIQFQIVSTVHEKTNFKKLVRYFASEGLFNIKFSFLFNRQFRFQYSYQEQKMMAFNYNEMLKWLISYNQKNSSKVRIQNISSILRTLFLKESNNCCIKEYCGAGKNVFCVDVNGDLLPFQGAKEKIGSLSDSKCLIAEKFNNAPTKIMSQFKLMVSCQRCKYLFLCGGGCPAESVSKKIGYKKDFLCFFKRDVFDYIFSLLEKNKKSLTYLL